MSEMFPKSWQSRAATCPHKLLVVHCPECGRMAGGPPPPAEAAREQALPTPGREDVFASLLARDLPGRFRARQQKGIATYGRSLETWNGRDVFLDLEQEQLDGLVYAEQARLQYQRLLRLVGELAYWLMLVGRRLGSGFEVLQEVHQVLGLAASAELVRRVEAVEEGRLAALWPGAKEAEAWRRANLRASVEGLFGAAPAAETLEVPGELLPPHPGLGQVIGRLCLVEGCRTVCAITEQGCCPDHQAIAAAWPIGCAVTFVEEGLRPAEVVGYRLPTDRRDAATEFLLVVSTGVGLPYQVRPTEVRRVVSPAPVAPGEEPEGTVASTGPATARKVIRCGSTFILSADGLVALCGRKDDSGLWSRSTGKVHPGETARQAAIREALEELGLVLAPEQLVEVYAATWPAAETPPGVDGHTTVFLVRLDLPAHRIKLQPGEGEARAGWFSLAALRDPTFNAFPLFDRDLLRATLQTVPMPMASELELRQAIADLHAQHKAEVDALVASADKARRDAALQVAAEVEKREQAEQALADTLSRRAEVAKAETTTSRPLCAGCNQLVDDREAHVAHGCPGQKRGDAPAEPAPEPPEAPPPGACSCPHGHYFHAFYVGIGKAPSTWRCKHLGCECEVDGCDTRVMGPKGERACALVPGHGGLHVDRDGYRWEATP
jgi:8-oxo-dGTP pyrophosphatase MutT (NUDIX family)